MNCNICQSTTVFLGQAEILQKNSVSFYRCRNCDFIQTEKPYWLDEAYSKAITRSDIGLIGRNLKMSKTTGDLIMTCFDPRDAFVDYGGGYGMFVRLMRDQGFNFHRYDPVCENLFADGFEAQPNMKYSLLTAWEVFEHLVDPLEEIKKMLSFSRNLFFSTQLLASPPKPLGQWWYYGLEHGQHVSFYSRKTLQFIARKFDLKLQYSNSMLHFMGDADINPKLLQLAFSDHLRWLRKMLAKNQPKSLLEQDYQKITGHKLQ
jgi:hypothetical protein